jgi:hypothetical protein
VSERTRRRAGYAVVLASLLFVGGCTESPSVTRLENAVRLVTLPDGTRCALFYYDGPNYGVAGNIDCDWSRP